MFCKAQLKKISKWVAIILGLFLIYPAGYFVLGDSQKISIAPVHTISQSVGAYIINLDRSQERYDSVKPIVNDLGFPVERISAVDGSTLSEKDLKKIVDFETYKIFFKQPPKKGTIGCSLSHIKVWETFLKSNFEYAIIFEDDVRFDPLKLQGVINELIAHHELWDINNFELHHRGLPMTIQTLNNDQKLVRYLLPVTHTGAYMINRKAAMRLLEKALPIKMPVDHYFTRVWELGLSFTGVENPRLVDQKPGASDIESSDRVLESKKSGFGFKRSVYTLKTGIIRVLYNLKCILVK